MLIVLVVKRPSPKSKASPMSVPLLIATLSASFYFAACLAVPPAASQGTDSPEEGHGGVAERHEGEGHHDGEEHHEAETHHDDGMHGEDQHAFRVGDIEVEHPWSRATEDDQALVFMEIENSGAADQLLSASSEIADSAGIVGVQLREGELMTVDIGPIDIPAAGDFTLDPDGAAIELRGLHRALLQGEEFEIVVTFAAAGEVELHVAIEASDARQHSHAGHEH